ncbi:MAG: preprotein translocase subunit SecE [Bacteroidetes bacterium]|nr:preprotein translocase subunit SecE [Bacteroidota bacterium]MBT6687317.1 preprotein translocase subunit SecE [Bacteroidota bacterium]MBT7143981.1 preprotein translocase subunit SecE [Bacteroidota bacterium]MBT7491106.1 preprotein translocase subunit SecE [Bacteroidota bacterium]
MMKIILYFKEVIEELTHKVSWPTRAELQSSAVVVMVASLIIAFTVFLMDFVLGINSNSVWKGLLGFIYDML